MDNVNKTLYIPLYGKAYVSRRGLLLKDKKAEQIWEAEGFPLKGKAKSKWLAYNMDMRSAVFDRWTQKMAAAHPDMDTLVLGCTHFPLVQDLIEELYPQFTNIIDPAVMQTKQIQAYLAEHDALNDEGGALNMFTSGDCAQYQALATSLGMTLAQDVQYLPAPTPLAE